MFNLAEEYKDSVNLSVGEPDFATPTHVVKAAIQAMKNGFTHYTANSGLIEFREAAANKLRRENQIEAEPLTEIIATTGAMGALSIAMLTTIDPGDEVLIPDPGFACYRAQVLLAGGKPLPFHLAKPDFSPDHEEIAALITPRTKALVINTPSNPTGSVFDKKSLRRIAEIVQQHNIMVISDEAYESITYDGFRHTSVAALPDMKSRTISIFSLSKTYAMTGWRIGFAVADQQVIKQMTKLQEHLTAHPSSVSQMAAVAALTGPKTSIRLMLKKYSERRKLILDELERIPRVDCSKPKGAFYVFPRIDSFNLSSDAFAMHVLREARVIVVSGRAFGEHGEGHIRISYAASENKIAQAMERLISTLKRIG